MARQPVLGYDPAATQAFEARSAAIRVARSVQLGGLTGPADAYQLIGYLDTMMKTTEDVLVALVAWLGDAEQQGRLTVREGPFVDEPEAASAVVADALTRASAACAQAQAQLERAHIAAADIGALPSPRRRPDRRRP